jgi:hypothetical protein
MLRALREGKIADAGVKIDAEQRLHASIGMS